MDTSPVLGWPCDRCGAVNGLAEEFCGQCGADGRTSKRAALPPPERPRFPSSRETRRAILDDLTRASEKYARPFDRGTVARASLVGTESWADYGAVVMQMAMLDTPLSIEEKLGELLTRLGPTQS
jgi:hypothetical protein